jgi:ketosteroid isomerase-like protein
MDKNIALAERMYELGFASDWPNLEAILTDDFEIVESSSLPFGGTYRGKKALEEVFGKVMAILQPKDVRRKSMTANDSEVVCLIDLVFQDGEGEFVMPVAEYFEIRGDKISRMVPYFFDTAGMNEFLDRRD